MLVKANGEFREVFIIGSGQSLLRLSEEQKHHIAFRPSLAFNKYLLFWQKVGIIPDYYVWMDRHDPSRHLFSRLCDEINSLFTMHDRPQLLFTRQLFAQAVKLPCEVLFIDNDERRWLDANFQDGRWATSFAEPIFHYRSTLTDCINIAHILFPAATIKLVGVDLNSAEYFFDEEFLADPSLHDATTPLHDRGKRHPSASSNIYGQPSPGVQHSIPFILVQLRKTGAKLVCCNSDGLLVREQWLEYAGITS